MQLLLTEDQYVIQTLPPNTSQETFTNRIGSGRVIRCFEHLDTARYCTTSETGSKLAIMIANQIPGRLSIRSRPPHSLSGPTAAGTSPHPHFADLPLFQF